MSDKDTSMDEKLVSLQYELVKAQLEGIKNQLDTYVKSLNKMVDDHEQRLREQAKESAVNAKGVAALQIEVKEIRHDCTTIQSDLSKRIDEMAREQKAAASETSSFWKTLALEAIKYVFLGAAGGGSAMAIMQALGRY
jgi:predicted  nucleic acid-binding Zn-ribbon protein